MNTVTHLRNVALELFTDISLDGIDFDITDAKKNTELDFTLSISNKGTHHVDGITVNLYNASGQLLYTTDCDIILESGVSEKCNVSLVLPQSICSEGYIVEVLPQYGMTEANDIDYTDNIKEISLAYADFSVNAEQKIIGEKNYIILSVSNDGNVSSTAKIEIYVPNTDGRMITSVETGVIAPGGTEQYFVELNALTSDEDNIVTCIVTSEIGDFYLINNTQTVSLLHINDNVFVTDPEQVIHNPEISVNTATFDKYVSQDIVLEITDEVDSFSGIEGLVLNVDYTLSGNIITISNNYMTNLGIGIHTLKFLFDYGYEEPTVRTLSIMVTDSTPVVLAGSISILGDVEVGNTVYADTSGLEPLTNKFIYNWSINGVTVSTTNHYSITAHDYGKTLILKITAIDGFRGEFTDENFVEKRKPTIPTAPIISKISSTTFAVIKSEGLEYSIDCVTWQDSNIFEDLLPHKTYTVYARKKATDTSYASDISSGTTLTTAKLTVSSPSVPELQSSTYDTITLVYDSAMEYKIEGGDWRDSNVFTGLEPNTTYIIYQRYKETDIAYASEYSSISFTTADRITIAGSITVVGEPQYGETLAVDLTDCVGDLNSVSYQWFADGIAISDAVQNTYTVTLDDMGKTIEVKVIGTGAYKGELTATLSIRDYVIGDMDGDNEITIRDATILRRHVAKWEDVTVNELAADVNNDGLVNIRDVTILRRYVAKWEGYEKVPQVA